MQVDVRSEGILDPLSEMASSGGKECYWAREASSKKRAPQSGWDTTKYLGRWRNVAGNSIK